MTVTPPVHDLSVRSAGAYNPWRDLRGRPHLTLKWADVKGCREVIKDTPSGRVVYLQHGLSFADRRCLLCHALIHDERGLFPPGASPQVCVKEETIVRDETAVRMIPPAELDKYLAECEAADEAVHAFMVAERFNASLHLAQRAMSLRNRNHRLYRVDDRRTA